VSKRGILDIDGATGRVTGFLEKPKPSETSSRWACPAFYVFRNSSLPLVRQYLDQPSVAGNRDAADAPGRFIQWLHKCVAVSRVLGGGVRCARRLHGHDAQHCRLCATGKRPCTARASKGGTTLATWPTTGAIPRLGSIRLGRAAD